MEIIETRCGHTNYPVGEYMHQNIPIIKDMTDALLAIEEFKDVDFNLICRGSSGAIIAAIMCTRIKRNCYIVHVKKPGEESHHANIRLLPNRKNIIVDDFIASGATLNAIHDKVNEWHISEFNTPFIPDAICVSGSYKPLTFEPKYFICDEK